MEVLYYEEKENFIFTYPYFGNVNVCQYICWGVSTSYGQNGNFTTNSIGVFGVGSSSSKGSTRGTSDNTTLSLTKTKIDLNKGKTCKISTFVKTNKKNTLSYSSSDKQIASVDKNGKVTAKKKGKVAITVKAGTGKTSKLATVIITVK